MSEQSYKILMAQRLAVDPNALLNYFELNEFAIATTSDGKQHVFPFSELRQQPIGTDPGTIIPPPRVKPPRRITPKSAKNNDPSEPGVANSIAETPQKGAGSASAGRGSASPEAKSVAARTDHQAKRVVKYPPLAIEPPSEDVKKSVAGSRSDKRSKN